MKRLLAITLSLLLLLPVFTGCAKETGVREITINEVTRSVLHIAKGKK